MSEGVKTRSRRPRTFPTDALLLEAYARGYARVAGVDEVGRGPLAGPVVAAAVILPAGFTLGRLDDSKKLTHAARVEIARELKETPGLVWALGEATVEEIDRLNILQAALLAMRRAVKALSLRPDYLHVDGNKATGCGLPERLIVGGDGKCVAVAAAAVIAKVYRDDLMDRLALEYPQYGLERHKGYGTREHIRALEEHGASRIHRRVFLRNIAQTGSGV
jgi:ribonuclease HII